MTLKNIASHRCSFVALLSAALLGSAPAVHAQLGAFNDPAWPQQEPSLGNSTAWGIRLPAALATGGSYLGYSTGVAVLSRGLSQENRFTDLKNPGALLRVTSGTVEPDPAPWVMFSWASYGDAAVGVLSSGVNNNRGLAGVAPLANVHSVRFAGEAPTQKEVIGTLKWAPRVRVPIVTIAADPAIGAETGFKPCSGDLQAAIDSAYKAGTLLFADSRNALLGKCNNVMLVGPAEPNSGSSNKLTQLRAPDQTWAPDAYSGSYKSISGMAPVIAAGSAVLVRSALRHSLDPWMQVNAEMLRAAMRAGAELCPDCESGHKPMNLELAMGKWVKALETPKTVSDSNNSKEAATVLDAGAADINIVSGSVVKTSHEPSDWYYVSNLQGKELSISLLQNSNGAYTMKVYNDFSYGATWSKKEVTTQPCAPTAVACPTSASLRVLPDFNVNGVWIEVVANGNTPQTNSYMLYAITN